MPCRAGHPSPPVTEVTETPWMLGRLDTRRAVCHNPAARVRPRPEGVGHRLSVLTHDSVHSLAASIDSAGKAQPFPARSAVAATAPVREMVVACAS
jgi:hypothetical protein